MENMMQLCSKNLTIKFYPTQVIHGTLLLNKLKAAELRADTNTDEYYLMWAYSARVCVRRCQKHKRQENYISSF